MTKEMRTSELEIRSLTRRIDYDAAASPEGEAIGKIRTVDVTIESGTLT